MKILSAKETIALINKIENLVDVKNWVVQDIHVWPIIRIHLAHQLNSVITHKSKNDFQALYPFLKKILRLIFNSIKNALKSSNNNADVLFLTYTVSKQIKQNGKWVDVYVEPIVNVLETIGLKYIILEYVGKRIYEYPVKRKSDIIDYKIFLNLIRARIYEHTINSNNTSDYLNQIDTILRQHNLMCTFSEKFIKRKISQLVFNYKYFHAVLKKYNPKIVFTTSYFSWGIALNLACNSLNIPSVDIQHGIQGEYHPAYGRWYNIPGEGYPGLPSVFAVWSSKEKSAIESWCNGTMHQAVVFGNNFSRYIPESTVVFSHLFDSNKIHVLVSLQKGRGLPALYQDLISLKKNIFWWIRKHPRMTTEEIKDINKILSDLKTSNYNFADASSLDLYILLRHMHFHITEFSTVALQASAFNIPTILVDESGKDYFESEILEGNTFYINNAQEIIDKIDTNADISKSTYSQTNSESDTNIKSFLNKYFLSSII